MKLQGLGAQSNASNKSKVANPLAKVFGRTNLVKDIRIAKEKAKQRRSELVYGTVDMKTKLFEREQRERKQRNNKLMTNSESKKKSEEDAPKAKKPWKQKLLFH